MGIAAAFIQSRAGERAADIQSATATEGIAAQEAQFAQILELLGPSIEGGDLARERQLALLGLRGPEAQAAAQANIQQSPGQKFIRDRQERALLRNQAAIGGAGGGNVRTALQEQAAGFASQDQANAFNQLSAISGAGQVAAGGIGQFGQQSTNQITNLLQQSGQAQAGAVLNSAQAAGQVNQNAITGLAAFFSDSKLKEKIKKIGEIGCLNVYEWVWKTTGLDDIGFIAEEVREHFPELVSEHNGYLMVNYDQAIEAA